MKRSILVTFSVAACLVSLAAGLVASPAASGGQLDCQTGGASFAFTGDEQCYDVPDDVDEIQIELVGGIGGDAASGQIGTPGSEGGLAASVSGRIEVEPGQRLFVVVGDNGLDASSGSGALPGGYNGGGATNDGGGAGGGATDIRTISCGDDCFGSATLGSRLLVAGGGGGGGFDPENQQAGLGGNGGLPNGGEGGPEGIGGGPGTTSVGGAAGPSDVSPPATPGALGLGGDGALGGGGGGGGLYGGGGGGNVDVGAFAPQGGGGGGGSSLIPEGFGVSPDGSGVPGVSIEPIADPPEPTAKTGAASRVKCKSAVLNGRVDPNGAETSYRFAYGLKGKALSKTTPSRTVDEPTAVKAAIRRLKPDKRYDYRLRVGSGDQVVDGAKKGFKTKKRC